MQYCCYDLCVGIAIVRHLIGYNLLVCQSDALHIASIAYHKPLSTSSLVHRYRRQKCAFLLLQTFLDARALELAIEAIL